MQLAHRLDDDEDDHETVPLVEERAVVRKRKRLTGGVRVRTTVHEDEQVIDETLRAEQVEVKRVPLDDRWVAAPVPVRQEGDTTVEPGDTVRVSLPPQHCHLFDAQGRAFPRHLQPGAATRPKLAAAVH